MGYREEWACALSNVALTEMIDHAFGWVKDQPVGWARDGALQRIDGVMRGNLKARLERAMRDTEYLPVEMCARSGFDMQRVRLTFERLAGRKPDHAEVVQFEQMDGLYGIDDDRLIRVNIRFTATERWVERSPPTLLLVGSGGESLASQHDQEMQPAEQFLVTGEVHYSRQRMWDCKT